MSSYYHYGVDDTKKETAKMMLEDGEPVEKIAKYTKLPLEEIKALQK